MKLFVDMDGVLADFDRHHEEIFGTRPNKKADDVDWKRVKEHENFYAGIPPMEDMRILWAYVKRFSPTVLTGIPSSLREEAEANKKAWIAAHLGKDVPVICCPSREKSRWGSAGDILIDDWEKHKELWIRMGGVWITHTSAVNSIYELDRHIKRVGM